MRERERERERERDIRGIAEITEEGLGGCQPAKGADDEKKVEESETGDIKGDGGTKGRSSAPSPSLGGREGERETGVVLHFGGNIENATEAAANGTGGDPAGAPL